MHHKYWHWIDDLVKWNTMHNRFGQWIERFYYLDNVLWYGFIKWNVFHNKLGQWKVIYKIKNEMGFAGT